MSTLFLFAAHTPPSSHLMEDVLINDILCSSLPKWLKTVVKMEGPCIFQMGINVVGKSSLGWPKVKKKLEQYCKRGMYY